MDTTSWNALIKSPSTWQGGRKGGREGWGGRQGGSDRCWGQVHGLSARQHGSPSPTTPLPQHWVSTDHDREGNWSNVDDGHKEPDHHKREHTSDPPVLPSVNAQTIIQTHAYTHTHTCTCTCTRTHTHVHAHTYMYTHTHRID